VWKRVQLVPFTQAFVDRPEKEHERQRDPDLPGKLRTEASAILGWLVRGCLAWQRDGLNPPESVRAATAEYQKEEDLVRQFIETECVTGPDKTVRAQTLYNAYRDWAQLNGIQRPGTQTAFGKRVAELFSKQKREAGVFYTGVGLLSGRNY
jgi:putative DNA primase/helicase